MRFVLGAPCEAIRAENLDGLGVARDPRMSLPVLLATAVSFFSAGSIWFWTREPLAPEGSDHHDGEHHHS
jgi:hypothetical protein